MQIYVCEIPLLTWVDIALGIFTMFWSLLMYRMGQRAERKKAARQWVPKEPTFTNE